MNQWQQQILINLRQSYPDLADIPDERLLMLYESWELSDKQESFPQWCEE